MPSSPLRSRRIVLAFAAVYILWGSTYMGARIAGASLPALVVSASRVAISAALVAVLCLAQGRRLLPLPGERVRLVLIGVLFMSVNNILLTWGVQQLPTGVSSLLVSTMPIMIAVLEAALPGGEEPLSRRGWAGTLLGTAGIAVLMWPRFHARYTTRALASEHVLEGTLALLAAAFAFAVGSVLSRRWRFRTDTMISTGWQLGIASIVNLTLATAVHGNLFRMRWTWPGTLAILYLSIFGALLTLLAFNYLLQHVPTTTVATYAFVNPLVAVALGVALLHERILPMELLGMVMTVCAVATVVFSRNQRGNEAP